MREERDPSGAELPLENPYGYAESYVDWKSSQPLFIEGGDPFDYSSGRTIDGLPVSEAEFQRRTGSGSAGAGVFIGGKFGGFIDLSGLEKTQIVPKPGDLRSRVEALLAKGGCAKYVQDLLNKVAERNPGNPRHGKTIMEIFGKIEKQGGYQLDARFYNTVSGDLFVTKGGQPATVHLLPWNTYGTPTAYDIREANRNYIYGALHETFHLAGKGGFDDEQLLRAAYDLANKAIPKHMENSKNSLNWSAMFDDELMQHCPK